MRKSAICLRYYMDKMFVYLGKFIYSFLIFTKSYVFLGFLTLSIGFLIMEDVGNWTCTVQLYPKKKICFSTKTLSRFVK